jgi:hypothetical protein
MIFPEKNPDYDNIIQIFPCQSKFLLKLKELPDKNARMEGDVLFRGFLLDSLSDLLI